jgi:DNA ligase-1
MHAIAANVPKGKRRRILDSDDEAEVEVPLSTFLGRIPELMLTVTAVTVTHSPSAPEGTSGEGKRKGGNTKVNARLRNVNDLMKVARNNPDNDPRMGGDEEASAAENEGDHHVDEEDDFLVSDGEESQAAVKNAQLAVSRVIDVDIDGGWKEGSP